MDARIERKEQPERNLKLKPYGRFTGLLSLALFANPKSIYCKIEYKIQDEQVFYPRGQHTKTRKQGNMERLIGNPEFPRLGIDIAKKTFAVTLLMDKNPHKQFPNTEKGFAELSVWLVKHQVDKVWVCMEHTNKYWRNLATYLSLQEHQVSVVNPYTFAGYAKGQARGKSDQQDSLLLATYCRDWKPRLWRMPSEIELRLKEISHARTLLSKQLQALKNHLDTLEFAETRIVLTAQIQFLEQQILELQKEEDQIIVLNQTMKEERARWLNVCGIGKQTANSVLVELGSLAKFERYNSLRKLAGLDSIRNQSGTSVAGKPHTSKQGSSRVRANLHMAALSAIQSNPRFRAFAQNLERKGKHPSVIITAVANKLLMTMWALSKHQQEFDANHRPAWLNKNSALLACA